MGMAIQLENMRTFNRARMLVVGRPDHWVSDAQYDDSIRFIDVMGLTAENLRDFGPDMVMSGLFVGAFDALDIATRLRSLGYVGPYRVVCRDLPNPGLVRKEIAEAAPGLDFDILAVPEVSGTVH